MTNQKYCLLEYDIHKWPFAWVLSHEVFKIKQLHRLHEFVIAHKQKSGHRNVNLTFEDNLNIRRLMQNLPLDSLFYKVYQSFMGTVISKLIGYPLSYSQRPKMRVHFPNTPSVSSFHKDVTITKRVDQINLWIPVTDVYDTATLWIESDYETADYSPIPVKYGQALIFDGGYLMHGTKANTTNTTRISFDLRFALKNASTRSDGLRLLEHTISQVKLTQSSLNIQEKKFF